MNIAVINGSPKGKYSITLQTIHYLESKFPEHTFSVLHVGQKIKALEKDFSLAENLLASADALLFSYPVYTFLVPSQLHRFLELLYEKKLDLRGKYATQVSTSKHFYDVTAHKFVEENVLDLGMRYIRGLSADMEDLLQEKGRREAEQFFERFLWSVKEDIYQEKCSSNVNSVNADNGSSRSASSFQSSCLNSDYMPVPATLPSSSDNTMAASGQSFADSRHSSIASCHAVANLNKDIVILTDNSNPSSNLQAMMERFRALCPYATRVVNISEYPMKGGCMGCLRCAVTEKCVYKDGFDSFLRENIQTADVIVTAFSISHHSMGSRFKMYDDRSFCNGHRTVTQGMPAAYLISGPYSREHNLQTIIEARSETGGNFLAGVATDEFDTDKQIDNLVKSLVFTLETRHSAPKNFWGVGGMKIFRDLIYQMRGMMRADHKFYKEQGIYDFPQKKWLTSLKMYLIGALLSHEQIIAKMGNKMNEGMLAPYKKILEKTESSSHTR